MAAEILEPIIGFLCPTPDSASACRDFISSHSSILPPIGPLFYFLLFPAVFTIVFIYILSGSVVGGSLKAGGFRLLIGVTAFIFIIISGWYPLMLVLSEFWYIAAIILAGFWYFIGSHFGKSGGGGGGPGGKMSAPGNRGIVGGALNYTGEILKKGGKETEAERILSTRINALEDLQKAMHDTKNDRAKAQYKENFNNHFLLLETDDLPLIQRNFGEAIYLKVLEKYQKRIENLRKHK